MNLRIASIMTGIVFALALGFLAGRMSVQEPAPDVATPERMTEALRAAFVEPDPLIRAREMERLMSALDERNLPGAIPVFQEFSTSAETLGVSEFFARWAQIDIDGLIEALRTWPNEKARAQGAGWVAYEYAARGGIARAIMFYDGLSTRLKLSTGYRLVEGALNSGDVTGLIEWVGAHLDEGERSRLTQSIVLKQLREQGTDGALSFFAEIPDDAPNAYKRQTFLVLLDKLVRHDPTAAIAFREAHLGDPYAENSMVQLAVAWTDVDPQAALSWVESQDEGSERSRALEAVIDRWATRDEAAAIAWSRAQLPSPMIDRLHRKFVGSLTIRKPELAAELAGQIQDERLRQGALRSFARYWFNRKPEDTRSWLEQAGLSELEAKALIAELTATRVRRMGDRPPRDDRAG